MPILSNPRHERFAQELAAGKTADEAYQLAGYAENRHNASRLKTKETILRRVAELQSRTVARLHVTLEWLIEKAEEARKQAMEMGQTSAAVGAIKELGVLSGQRVEKSERRNVNIDDMSDDELIAVVRGEAEAEGKRLN